MAVHREIQRDDLYLRCPKDLRQSVVAQCGRDPAAKNYRGATAATTGTTATTTAGSRRHSTTTSATTGAAGARDSDSGCNQLQSMVCISIHWLRVRYERERGE